MAKPRLASFYRQLICSIADRFGPSPTLCSITARLYYRHLLRSFADHFVPLATGRLQAVSCRWAFVSVHDRHRARIRASVCRRYYTRAEGDPVTDQGTVSTMSSTVDTVRRAARGLTPLPDRAH